jgi:hypothetical protein
MSLMGEDLKKGDLVMITKSDTYYDRRGDVFKIKYVFSDFVIVYSTDDGFDIPIKKEILDRLPTILEVLHD